MLRWTHRVDVSTTRRLPKKHALEEGLDRSAGLAKPSRGRDPMPWGSDNHHLMAGSMPTCAFLLARHKRGRSWYRARASVREVAGSREDFLRCTIDYKRQTRAPTEGNSRRP